MPVYKRDVSSLAKSGSAKLKGDVTLSEGSNITLTQSGQDISIAAAGGSGDVSKVGTPANNQMAVWTGDGTLEGTSDFTYDGTSLNLITGKNFQIAGSTILADSTGTTTLSNIDALDATTEATIESAIDTLANLTAIQGWVVTLTGNFIRVGAHSLTLTTTNTTDVTLPTTGTLATLAGTETLSGKTLTAPKLASGGFIADANGNELLIGTTTASAVNEVTVTNAATTTNPTIAATGGDTDISLDLRGKGTGGVRLQLRTQAIDGSTNATTAAIRIQAGVAFIEHDATEASAKAITFPTAFSTVLGVLVSMSGAKASGADPTDITDTTSGVTDTVQYTQTAAAISTTGFNLACKRTAASSGVHQVVSWWAWGT